MKNYFKFGMLMAVGSVAVTAHALGIELEVGEKTGRAVSADELVAAAEPIRRFLPKDTFETTPNTELTQTAFVVEQIVGSREDDICYGMPNWRYDANERELQLFYLGGIRLGFEVKDRNDAPTGLSSKGMLITVPIRCVQTDKGSYRASNAFGATTTIIRRSVVTTEIAVKTPSGHSPTSIMLTSVSMEPDEARLVTANLAVRVEGNLIGWNDQTSLICGIVTSSPNMRTVYDTTTDTCVYQGIIEKVTFFDKNTGSVVAAKEFRDQ